MFEYIREKTPFLESVTFIKTGENQRDKTYQTLGQLENMLDELRTRFIFLYHFKVNEYIKNNNLPEDESKKYEKAIIPKVFNLIIFLSIFLINLINLIRWLNHPDVITADEEEIHERVRQIKLLIERDCPNELNEIALTYETINKSIEATNIER